MGLANIIGPLLQIHFILVFGLDEFSCIQKETKIVGNKFKEISSSSWEDCQMKCQDKFYCKNWTFEDKNKKCALFNDLDDVADDHESISGPRDCKDFVKNTSPLGKPSLK